MGCWLALWRSAGRTPALPRRPPILRREAKRFSTKFETTVTAQNTQVDLTSAIDDGKNCGQSRKRLFVEGEGWIVRRVTTCY